MFKQNRILVIGLLIGMILPAGLGQRAQAFNAAAPAGHLLLCEAVATPTSGEYIEIFNPTASPVALDNYYLSDDEDYALTAGASGAGPAPSIGSSDFIAQFPAGASIPANGVVVIAFDGAGFMTDYGFAADFEIHGTDAGTPDMIGTDIGGSAGLTNSGESAVLFNWDGASDLVLDVDMLNIGTPSASNDIGDKTSLSVDGPDGGVITSTYAADAVTMPQQSSDPGFGFSTKRILDETGNETMAGTGNGITGDDETTENIANTWDSTFTAPDPGECLGAGSPGNLVINEVDADTPSTDVLEFIEIYDGGVGNTALDGYVVVLFNGSDNQSYTPVFDLDGQSTDGDGYFVIGNAGVANVDLVMANDALQNGADAVALYVDDGTTFPNDTALTLTNLVDAIVYDTNDGDDADLLPLLNAAQPQVNEDDNGDKDNHSNQRCDNGTGGQRNTDTYDQFPATPGAENTCGGGPAPVLLINEVDADTPSTDVLEFIELYDGGVGNTALDGYVVVLYNGSDDQSYTPVFDLDGLSTDGDGYFVIGNAGVANVDLALANGALQNGADAVALYLDDGTTFPNDTALTLTNLVDAIVYDTNDSNDAILLTLLNPSQPQVNEDDNGDKDNHSNQRCANGSGGLRNTDTYTQRTPTPGAENDCPVPNIIINEVDADTPSSDVLEFIELYDGGVGNSALDGFVIVLYNGSDNQSYTPVFDLDGLSTDGDGYFVIGNSGVANVDLVMANGALQNGADAVALYLDDGATFPNDTTLTLTNLVDAIVYDTNDGDDADLLPLLNASQPQVNEDDNGDKDNHSNQRCENGSGGERNTDTYDQFPPTPGEANFCGAIDLELHKDVSATLVSAGDAITYTLTISNTGPDDATGVVVEDYLPSTTTQIENVGNDCGAILAVDTLTWTIGGLASGASASCTVTADVRAGTGDSQLTNEAQVTAADQPDSDSAVNNLSGTPDEDDEDREVIQVGSVAACGTSATFISAIQGDGLSSLLDGQVHTVEGIVVATFQPGTQLDGFFLQEEDADADANALTSEGIFINDNGYGLSLVPGDKVRVSGTVDEQFSLTELDTVTSVELCSQGNSLPTAASVSLPVADINDLEPYEGMRVSFAQTLYVTELFTLGRFGEVRLSVADRLFQGTHVTTPGAPALAQADLNARSQILLDDGRTSQNDDPTLHPFGGLSFANSIRGGDSVASLSGVLSYAFSEYRVQPTGPVSFVPSNPRPVSAPDVGGSLTVANLNVLNYFTTLDGGGSICGPGANLGCRGADTASEFTRQRDKLISAILDIDADILGLVEIENHVSDAALDDLIAGLNAATAPGTYAKINSGPIGTDAIKVALIYKPASVSPVGAHAILDSSVDPNFIDTKNRPVLAQTFMQNATGELLTIAVNHFKSKGSACDDVGDPNGNDGQGNCNGTRTLAANALATWLAGDPTSSGDADFLIIGDLNAYAMEDPIAALQSAGYTDLAASIQGPGAYSYVFNGEWGYLDYALSNASLSAQVTGVAEYHINSDEPIVLDYNEEFKTANHVITLYDSSGIRVSDHDPVIIGLDLNTAPSLANLDALPIAETDVAIITGDILDVGIDDTFTLTVDWGEGAAQVYTYPVGTQAFTITHQYLDDDPTGTPEDDYVVQLTIADDHGASTIHEQIQRVHNVNPTLQNVDLDVEIDEDATGTLSGDINEISPLDSFALLVDWGDGTVMTYTYPAGSATFSETHQYLDDDPPGTGSDVYIVTVILADDDSGFDGELEMITVNNLDPDVDAGADQDVVSGFETSFAGTIDDPGTLDTFTIEWDFGDGNSASGSLTPSHTFNIPGIYIVTLTVTDDDGGVGVDTLTVTVLPNFIYLPIISR